MPESHAPAAPSRLPALKLVTGGPDAKVGAGVRVFAAVAVLGVLALVAGLAFMGGSSEESLAASSLTVKPLTQRNPAAVPPVSAPAAAEAPAPAPKPESILPAAVERALKRRPVVVVSLYAKGAPVAAMARDEAAAGAALAGSAFVALDVLDQKQVEKLTALLGVTSDPMVLVFRRPGRVFLRFDGFADRETVAQAAANARESS